MARYTISYEDMHNLMTPAQKAQETSIFALITNTTLRDSFRKYYELYYRECEIETGTPAGYLLDFNRCMIGAAGYINNIFAQLDKDGYLTHKNESETKTGNATKTDTPGITTTTETDNIFSDTPQSAGAIDNNYATNTSKAKSKSSATGKDTQKDEYTETIVSTTDEGTLYRVLMNPKIVTAFDYCIKLFTPCFIGLY